MLANDDEFCGLIGRGYPHSFYKIFVRAPQTKTPRWYCFEDTVITSSDDPVNAQRRMRPGSRVVTVLGTIEQLGSGDWKVHDKRAALKALLARAQDLAGIKPEEAIVQATQIDWSKHFPT